MTYKAAVSGLDQGGGKTVVLARPAAEAARRVFRALGRFIDTLGGRYIAAEDVGTSPREMEWVIARDALGDRRRPRSIGGSGDPSPLTAIGVFEGDARRLREPFGVGRPRRAARRRAGLRSRRRAARADARATPARVVEVRRPDPERAEALAARRRAAGAARRSARARVRRARAVRPRVGVLDATSRMPKLRCAGDLRRGQQPARATTAARTRSRRAGSSTRPTTSSTRAASSTSPRSSSATTPSARSCAAGDRRRRRARSSSARSADGITPGGARPTRWPRSASTRRAPLASIYTHGERTALRTTAPDGLAASAVIPLPRQPADATAPAADAAADRDQRGDLRLLDLAPGRHAARATSADADVRRRASTRFTAEWGFVPCEVLDRCERPGVFELADGDGDGSRRGRASPGTASILAAAERDVHARRLAAPARQHAVPVGLRQQHRGLARAVCAYLLFYLVCGPARRARPSSRPTPTSNIPNIGASGAIAGVLGGYLLLHPRARVLTRDPAARVLHDRRGAGAGRARRVVRAPVARRSASLVGPDGVGGVAYWAHVGGFVSGLLLVRLFMLGAGRRRRRPMIPLAPG